MLNAAFDVVDARVNGHLAAPQLSNKRPAQAPEWTLTGGVSATPRSRVSLSANLRYEGPRFADDQNTIRLASAVTVDARASYALTDALSLYVYGDNLFNARVASTAAFQPVGSGATELVTNYAAPRIVGGGLSWTTQ